MSLFRTLAWIIVVSATLAWTPARAATYPYVRWTGSDRLVIEEPIEDGADGAEGRIVVGNDAILRTVFCGVESDYHCFFSTHHAFAVPRALDSHLNEWTVRGVRFEVTARDVSLSILGRRIDNLYIIRAPENSTPAGGKAFLYAYSPREGLVAFASEDLRVTYWLEGDVGFGVRMQNNRKATESRGGGE